MRELGEKINAPAATVSQVEKGQRALKKPKIALWAAALEVNEADLSELWELSQGWIPVGPGSHVFYTARPDELGTEPLRDALVPTLRERPGLESIYRLAERIAAVLRRLLPDVSVQVDPDQFEPPHVDKMAAGLTLTAAEEGENAEAAETFVPLPLIECYRDGNPGRREPSEMKRHRVGVPLLRELTTVVQRRRKSVKAVELEDLIRELSGLERERVRGYIEAIVEQRADTAG